MWKYRIEYGIRLVPRRQKVGNVLLTDSRPPIVDATDDSNQMNPVGEIMQCADASA
jgi:hypothetical protein